MRLLSFLTQIEDAMIAESPASDGAAWETARIVNYHQAIARLTLTPRAGNPFPGGGIFVQSFALADGSLCLKASLSWRESDSFPVFAVYASPTLNWKLEASRIASAWLEGPIEMLASSNGAPDFRPLATATG